MEKEKSFRRKRKSKTADELEAIPPEKLKKGRLLRSIDGGEEEDDDSYFVNVEQTSVCDEEGARFIKHVQVNLLSHCVFCLRRTTKDGHGNVPNSSDNVPRADQVTCPPSVFNRTWSYLQNSIRHTENDDPLSILKSNQQDTLLSFLQLPVMCAVCAEEVSTIAKLFQELNTHLDVLGKIIKESKYGGKHAWRAELFEKTLSSSKLDREIIDATFKILDRLGKSSDMECSHEELLNEDNPNCELGDFVDENDEWNESDPDYIKSESDQDSSEQEFPWEDDNDWSTPETRSDLAGQKPDNVTATGSVESVTPTGGGRSAALKKMKAELRKTSTLEPEKAQGKFKCKIKDCNESFNHWRAMRNHKAEKHGFYPSSDYPCKECGKSYSSREGVMHHMRTVHSGTGPVQMCDLCKVMIPVKDIYEHVRAHVGDEYLTKCPNPQCPHVYSHPRALFYRHLNQRTNRSKNCQGFLVPSKEEYSKALNVCEVCGYEAVNSHDLRGHLLHVHEEPTKNVSCPIDGCSQRFTVRQSVLCHISQHDMRRAFDTQNCADCTAPLLLADMPKHLQESHGAKEVIKCNRCPFLFSSRQQLVDHLFVHRHGVLSCDICGDQVKFNKHAPLRDHYFRVHGIGKRFPCEHCDHVSATRDWWLKHNMKHHGGQQESSDVTSKKPKEKRTHDCDLCDAVFTMNYRLRDHKIKVHGAEPYACKFCSETRPSQKLLVEHEREHKGVLVEEFRCEVDGCEMVFKHRKTLRAHISSFHLGERPHVCELCGKSFARDSYLKQHKSGVHLGLKPSVCEICGESFTTGTNLRRHQRIHTGERPFACSICEQKFRTRDVLKRHMEGHEKKGVDFKPSGPMKQIRKRVERKTCV